MNPNEKPIALADTVKPMLSADAKERLVAEYHQLAIRKNGLGNYLWKIREGKAEKLAPELHKNLIRQFGVMRKYKKLLEEKARLMKIDIKEVHRD